MTKTNSNNRSTRGKSASAFWATFHASGDRRHAQTSSSKKWDAARVKAELPNVPVQIDGEIFVGLVRGRALDFAHIHVGDDAQSPGPYRGFVECAWSTIADVLNKVGAGLPSAVRW